MKMLKSYSELISLDTFDERIQYLFLGDKLGIETFGNMRFLNQKLYTSPEWIHTRDIIIARDDGCDLGVEGCYIVRDTKYKHKQKILIHHINPITIQDILNRSDKLFDPENLISLSLKTHNYIHYGTEYNESPYVERTPYDTCPWNRRR